MSMSPCSDTVSQALFQSLIKGPPLVGNLPEAEAFPCRQIISTGEKNTLNLEQKLGHLYEDALTALLESTPQYETLGKAIQIQDSKSQTLGELDFLIRDLSVGQLIHLELAVKFYLAVQSEAGVLLPGPDARDNYFRKLERMRTHQLQLVKKFRSLLPELFRHENITVQQLVHGCIFDHIHASHAAAAEFLNADCRRGKWLRQKECTEYFGRNTTLKVIPKPLWPVPLGLLPPLELETWNPDDHLKRCVMVQVNSIHTPHFITPNGYPSA